MVDYLKEVCPKCYDVATYVANPDYVFNCDCGFEGHQTDIITVVDDEVAEAERKTLEELLDRFPMLSSLREG